MWLRVTGHTVPPLLCPLSLSPGLGLPRCGHPPFSCAGLVRCPLFLAMQGCFWPSVVSHVLVLSRVGMAFPMALLWCCIRRVHGATWGQHVFPCAMKGWRGVPHVHSAIAAVTAEGLCRARRTSSSELTSSQPTPDAAAAVASWGSVWVWGQRLACAQLCPHTPLSSPCWPRHTAGVAVATTKGARVPPPCASLSFPVLCCISHC